MLTSHTNMRVQAALQHKKGAHPAERQSLPGSEPQQATGSAHASKDVSALRPAEPLLRDQPDQVRWSSNFDPTNIKSFTRAGALVIYDILLFLYIYVLLSGPCSTEGGHSSAATKEEIFASQKTTAEAEAISSWNRL